MRLLGTIYFLCAVIVLVLASACGPSLTQQSAAPPARIASLEDVTTWIGRTKWYDIELSSGVALAMTCDDQGPCQKPVITSDDPNIAEVRNASLNSFDAPSQNPYRARTVGYIGFVVVGKAPGKTRLHLKTAKGHTREIHVTIVAPPPQSAPATVAR